MTNTAAMINTLCSTRTITKHVRQVVTEILSNITAKLGFWQLHCVNCYLFVLTSYCREVGLCRFAAVIKTFGISLVQDPCIIVRTEVPEIQYRMLARKKNINMNFYEWLVDCCLCSKLRKLSLKDVNTILICLISEQIFVKLFMPLLFILQIWVLLFLFRIRRSLLTKNFYLCRL